MDVARPIEVLFYQFLSGCGTHLKIRCDGLLKEADAETDAKTEDDLVEDIHIGHTEDGEHHGSEEDEHNEVDDEGGFAPVLGEVLAFQVVDTDDEGEKDE